jgi:hypothetical protein
VVNEEHLDPELVAAWAEGSLDPSARAAAEAHAADCLRCQAVLAAMVRTEPVAAHPSRSWFRSPLRWALPLATAGAALAVWIATQSPQSPPLAPAQVASRSEEAPKVLAGRAAQSAPAISAPVDPTTPAPAPAAKAPERQTDALAKREGAASDADARSRNTPQPPAAPQSKPAAVGETAAEARVDELRRDPLAGRGAPPSPPAAVAQPAEAVPVLSETVRTKTAQQGAGASARFMADAVLRDVASPDPAVRYRVGAKGLIQRSTDGGRTWVVQPSGVDVALIAAAAPAPTVCWVVGRSGVVLLSADGTTWRRIPFPDQGDLRGVSAENARTASVTTADGRVFQTKDGGTTWIGGDR